MFKTTTIVSAGILVACCLLATTGCQTAMGPNLGVMGIPVPVSPYFQDKMEDDNWNHKRYDRVPILGPITSGGPPVALDPPSDDEIMRAMEKARPVQGGLPLMHEVQRSNVRIVVEPIADYVDPVRVYPLIGPAQLHHAHYKCIIYFTENKRIGWPIPATKSNLDGQEVIYIDHNHLHMAGNVDGGPGSNYQQSLASRP